MKNLQTLKKFAAIVVSAMMVLSTLALPTFAAKPDNTTATIKGVEYNATVTGYQFVEQDEQTSKWKPCAWVGGTALTGKDEDKGFTFEYGGQTYTLMYDGSGDYAAALDALAYKAKTSTGTINTVKFSTTAQSGTGDFTATLNKRGSYVVTAYSDNEATGENGITVYKPMVVSRAVAVDETDGKLYENAGTVDNVATAKSSNTAFDKVIKTKADSKDGTAAGGNKNVEQGENSNKGDTLKPGDETTFQITFTAPAYSEDYFVTQGAYTGPTVKVSDSLDKLTLTSTADKFVVKKDGDDLDSTKYDLVIDSSKKAFTLTITDKDTLKAGGDYVVEYNAVLDADANTGFIANTNTAKYEYTRKPGVDNDGKPFNNDEEEKTFHYTFDIDGSINGGEEGREIIKVGIDNYTGDIVTSEKNWETGQSPLAGATFVLLNSDEEVVCAAVSDKNGLLKASDTKVKYKGTDYTANGLTKLDAGEYDLVEVTAPDPYRPYENPIHVSIKAKLYEADDEANGIKKGMLEWYSVEVNGEDTNEYTFNAGNKKWDTVYKYTDKDRNPVECKSQAEFSAATNIVNTQISTLPSTGGMGTVLFTVGGIAIMALAIFLLFGGKKKQEQK